MKIFVISDTHDKIITPPVDFDASIHLGDAIEYFANKKSIQACVDAFRQYTYTCIGNHEEMLLKALLIPFPDEKIILHDDSRIWLRQLRRQPVRKITIDSVKIRISHYIVADPVTIAAEPSNEPFAVLNLAKSAEFNIVMYGHTHFQYEQKISNVWFVNPGNGERGEYAEINIENSKIISIELKTIKTLSR